MVIHARSFEAYSRSGCDGDYSLILACNAVLIKFLEQLVRKVVTSLQELLTPPTQSTELRVAQYAPRYRVAFTLLNEDAAYGGAVAGWEVEKAIAGTDVVSILHIFQLKLLP